MAIGDAAAPPIVVVAFLRENPVEAEEPRLDAAVQAEPERDGKKSGDESEDLRTTSHKAGGVSNAREEFAACSKLRINENYVCERKG